MSQFMKNCHKMGKICPILSKITKKNVKIVKNKKEQQ